MFQLCFKYFPKLKYLVNIFLLLLSVKAMKVIRETVYTDQA